jgi:hypothetical protein
MTRRQPRTVQEVCRAKLGVHRGALAAANVAQYAITTHELGRFPTAVEYADWWAISERTAWRHRERITDAFGDDWREVVEAVADEIGGRLAPRDVMNLPVPVPA